jgi:hypothetical protein
MNQKTESPEFASGFIWQICLLTFLAAAFVLYSQKASWPEDMYVPETYTPTLFPWVVAAGQTIESGLLAFGGKPVLAPGGREEADVLVALLLAAVVFPTVFLLEWRRRKVSGHPSQEREPLRVSGVLYALSGVIVLLMAVTILPTTIVSESARSSLRHRQALQTNRDAVMYGMNLIDVDLSQYYILPKDLGGGSHSYKEYHLPPQLAKSDDATYVVTAEDKRVSIRATSTRLPSGWISVEVDSAGRMSNWAEGGDLQW